MHGNQSRTCDQLLFLHSDIKNDFHAALERREAELLTLVDRQVEVKQEMLGELRLEVAAARAKVLAAREEGETEHTHIPLTLVKCDYSCLFQLASFFK